MRERPAGTSIGRRVRRATVLLIGVLAACLSGGPAVGAAIASFRYEHGQPLNDLRTTPGAVLPVGLAQICVVGYTRRVRNVPPAEALAVYHEYGIFSHTYEQYE